jgi:hypothetical protein
MAAPLLATPVISVWQPHFFNGPDLETREKWVGDCQGNGDPRDVQLGRKLIERSSHVIRLT